MILDIDCELITLSVECRITNFDCGDDDLNNFFNNEALSYKEQLLAQTKQVDAAGRRRMPQVADLRL
jgi:hypothetical protein